MEEILNKFLEVREFYGFDVVVFLVFFKVFNEENYLFQKIVCFFGMNNIDNCVRLCYEVFVYVFKLVVGMGVQINFYEDILKFKFVLIWGYNLVEIYLVVMDYILRVKKSGVKIIVVDVREMRMMVFVDYRFIIRFGIDIVLVNVFVYVIIEEEFYNEEFIWSRIIGFFEVRMVVKKYILEYVERVIGVFVEKIKEVVRDFFFGWKWGRDVGDGVNLVCFRCRECVCVYKFCIVFWLYW